MLPPYETQDTLWRLEDAIQKTKPETVICLGDSFDDLGAAMALDTAARRTIAQLQSGRRWIWIEGNHDPGPVDIGGSHHLDATIDPLVFRHIATPQTETATGEISGHYHPKAALPGVTARPCFLATPTRLILPAFGAYTGGLSIKDPVFAPYLCAKSIVILTGKSATAAPAQALAKRR